MFLVVTLTELLNDGNKIKLPYDGKIDKDAGDKPNHKNGDCCPQDLGSVPPEGHLLGLRLGCHPNGKQGDEEGGEVCKEVGCVCGNGQGVAEHPTHDLGEHEENTEHGCCHQLTTGSELKTFAEAQRTQALFL